MEMRQRLIRKSALRQAYRVKWAALNRRGQPRFEQSFFDELERQLDRRLERLLNSGSRRTLTAFDARMYF